MKPFREHVAIAIDGGGIKGLIVARALEIVEDHLGRSLHDTFRLTAGTSTGSIIAAGIGAGLSGEKMTQLYKRLGPEIFRMTWRSRLWPLTRYRYASKPLEDALREHLDEPTRMGDFWSRDPKTDVVITVFDLADNRMRFVKPWKEEYKDWPVVKAVLASSSVPTYFPVVDGRYADGGVGGYSNPCFLAAYEISHYLNSVPGSPTEPEHPHWGWRLEDTTLISLGTGLAVHHMPPADRLWPWEWLKPLMGAFLQSADDHQVRLVDAFFEQLDFRRFQVTLDEPIEMDDAGHTLELLEYGEALGKKILNDEWELKDQEPFKVA